jgi:hypothetical protein
MIPILWAYRLRVIRGLDFLSSCAPWAKKGLGLKGLLAQAKKGLARLFMKVIKSFMNSSSLTEFMSS